MSDYYSPFSSEGKSDHPPFNASAYDALEPPKQARFITDPDTAGEVRRQADDFFAKIRASLFMTATKFDSYFVVQPLFTTQYPNTQFVHQHDTEILQLRAGGHQTIAAAQSDFVTPQQHLEPLAQVYNERDNANWHVVSFLKFPIGDFMRRQLDTLAREGLLDGNYPEAFVNRFQMVPVPKPLQFLEKDSVADSIARDAFFTATSDALMSPLAQDAALEVREIALDPSPLQGRPIEHLHELAMKEGMPLAYAHTLQYETGERDVTFGKYPLSVSTISALREIESLSKNIG